MGEEVRDPGELSKLFLCRHISTLRGRTKADVGGWGPPRGAPRGFEDVQIPQFYVQFQVCRISMDEEEVWLFSRALRSSFEEEETKHTFSPLWVKIQRWYRQKDQEVIRGQTMKTTHPDRLSTVGTTETDLSYEKNA